MAEYIDREDVYNTMKAMYCDECTDEKCQMCEYAKIMFVLDNLPIADVQPVKHGRWIGVDYDTYFECSECKHMTDWQNYKYCPYCGARMDGEQND